MMVIFRAKGCLTEIIYDGYFSSKGLPDRDYYDGYFSSKGLPDRDYYDVIIFRAKFLIFPILLFAVVWQNICTAT